MYVRICLLLLCLRTVLNSNLALPPSLFSSPAIDIDDDGRSIEETVLQLRRLCCGVNSVVYSTAFKQQQQLCTRSSSNSANIGSSSNGSSSSSHNGSISRSSNKVLSFCHCQVVVEQFNHSSAGRLGGRECDDDWPARPRIVASHRSQLINDGGGDDKCSSSSIWAVFRAVEQCWRSSRRRQLRRTTTAAAAVDRATATAPASSAAALRLDHCPRQWSLFSVQQSEPVTGGHHTGANVLLAPGRLQWVIFWSPPTPPTSATVTTAPTTAALSTATTASAIASFSQCISQQQQQQQQQHRSLPERQPALIPIPGKHYRRSVFS